MNSQYWLLVLTLSAAAGFNGLILWHFRRRMPEQILLATVVVVYCLQPLWILSYVVLDGSALVQEAGSDMSQSPFRVAVGTTLIPISAWVVGSLFSGRRRRGPSLLQQALSRRDRVFEVILCVFATDTLLYYIALTPTGVPFLNAVFSYLHISFFLTPVLVGLAWRHYRLPVLVFLVAMSIGGMMAFTGGARSLLFLPMAFFLTGIWLTLKLRAKVASLVAGMVMALPTFYLSAVMEVARQDFKSDSGGSILRIAGEMGDRVFKAGGDTRVIDQLAVGVGRMVPWTYVAALCDSPERVPYRGFGDLWEEFLYVNQSTLFRDSREFLVDSLEQDFGLGTARLYGYSISAGGTVPFPVLADGWSRFGFAGAFLFGFILCGAWAVAEWGIRRGFAEQPHYAVALIAILANSAFDKMAVYGLIYNLRYLFMQVCLWVVLTMLVRKLLPASSRQRRTVPREMTGVNQRGGPAEPLQTKA